MNIEYTKQGIHYLPNIVAPKNIKIIHNYCNICGRCVDRLEKLRKEFIEQKKTKKNTRTYKRR